MRALLWHVNAKADPPEMTICFLGVPHMFVTVRIKNPGKTIESASAAAARDMKSLTATAMELLHEQARPARNVGIQIGQR